MDENLKQAVCLANIELHRQKLVIYSWGNVSAIDRDAGVVAIKPSGVSYDELSPEKIVLVNLSGEAVQPGLRPSSDTPTHLELYSSFETIGAICHTHSPYATVWAQSCRQIPCLGTTHADYFYGPIPVTRQLTADEIRADYELNTAKVIAERFTDLDPLQMPAVLVAGHGPFTWGRSPADAVEAAVVLEQVAFTAWATRILNPDQAAISQVLLDKHYLRKHGRDAYYGQK